MSNTDNTLERTSSKRASSNTKKTKKGLVYNGTGWKDIPQSSNDQSTDGLEKNVKSTIYGKDLNLKNKNRESLSVQLKTTLKEIDRFIDESVTIFINQLETEQRARTQERG